MEVKRYDRLVYFCITSMGNVYHNEKSKGDGRMRTEQDILKDFEALGYEVNKSYNHILLSYENENELFIWFSDKTYSMPSGMYLDMQEHKLLNELFIIWGWI